MNLTAAELSLLRSQPHKTDLYLSIFRPNTVMTARVTGTYSTGDTTISYYSPSGDYTNLYPDLTVMVGTVPNSDDVARIRLRAASGTYFVAAENGITWETGQYLTFLDFIDVQAVYPKIIQDPNNAVNVIFYKDGDIPYSNQNSIYGTFPCAGPHRAVFLESGTATVYYTATGTYNVAGSALTYSWGFQGGTPTGTTALTPGNVTYSTPGHYKTRLITTAANGAVDTTYRYVSVYDRPGRGSSPPTLRWEITNFQGSRSEGGYTATIKTYENLGDVQPNALVVIFADTWYGGTKQSIGGNAQGNQSIVFVGYILEDTIRFNYEMSYVEFQVGSVSEVMKNAEGFSVSCESKASPATWFELLEMTVPKAIYHYLRWHSTVLKVTDFQYTGDDRLVQYFDADRGSLFDAVDSFMRDGMLGSVISDRQGKLWAEISPFGLQTPFSTIPRYFTFHKQDWIDTPSIEEKRTSELSFIELGGIIYYGVSSNAYSACLTNAPSTAPLYYGKSDRKDGLILVSQLQLNQVSGNYLAHFNTKFPNVSLSLAGNYSNLDIAPLERSSLVIDQNDTVRGKSIQDLQYIIEGMEWSYSGRDEVFRPDVTLTQIATGTAGQTVLIPATPPDGGYGYPEIELPPLPSFPSAGGEIIPTSRAMIIHDTTQGVLYTLDFDSSSPTWLSMNGGLTTQQYQTIDKILITPNGTVYASKEGGWSVGNRSQPTFIARASSLGGMWTIIEDRDTVEAKYTGGAGQLCIKGLGVRRDVPDTAIYLAGQDLLPFGDTSDIDVYLGSGGTFAATLNLSNIRVDGLGYATYGNNTWGISVKTVQGIGSVFYFHVLNSGATAVTSSTQLSSLGSYHIRAAQSNILYNTFSVTQLKTSTDNGLAWAQIPSSNDMANAEDELDCDDTGQFLMARWPTVGQKGRSSDYGYSWLPLPNLPPGVWYFRYMGGTGAATQWVAVGSSVVRYSPDFGNTWLNREGNLIGLGTVNIDQVTPVRS